MSDKTILIDPRGDIRLQVGRAEAAGNESLQSVDFVACSRTLARVSPVFDRMLYGSFAEATSTLDWTIELAEVKPTPMEVFLNIAHANFAAIPRILSVDNLYDLAVLTHYYDATPLLVPWIQGWMASILDTTRDTDLLMPKMLWISWEFGRKEDFILITRRMLMEARTSWSTETGQMDDVQAPPYIIERINTARIRTIQELLAQLRDMVESLMVVDEGPRWCHHATWLGHHRCESMILGSMTFCLARAGLWPLPDATSVELSLHHLYQTLTSLIIHDIGETTKEPQVDHHECNPASKILHHVQTVIRAIPDPLTDYHFRRLHEQSQRLQRGV